MTATMTAGGIGLFLLIWALLRGGLVTTLLAVFGVALLGAGVVSQLAHGLAGAVASILNSLGGAM